MYKVYQDPDGIQCLDQRYNTQATNRSIYSENEETYKRKIKGLNEEIKVLNNEIEMVTNSSSC